MDTGTETPPVSVALYVRAACFTQAILDEQLEALERYAAQNDMRVVRRYVEGGLPGNELKVLVKSVMSGSADFSAIVMRDISRWGRKDPDATAYYEYLCRRAGIDVRYVLSAGGGALWQKDFPLKVIGEVLDVHER